MSGKKRTLRENEIVKEAAIWVARLQSSDATDGDREEFAQWASLDPAHSAMFDELLGLWRQLKDAPVSPERLAQLRKSRRGTLSSLAIVGLLASAVALSAYHLGVVDRIRSDHYTVVGEVRSVELADGSRAYLNTDTAIAVTLTESERRVTLMRGEAFFDVKPAPDRPFVVVVEGGLAAEALGTRYSVRSAFGDKQADVQVEEGKVRILGADRPVTLGPGEGAIVSSGRSLIRFKVDEDQLAWRTGKLVFSGRPLSEVLTTLGHYRSGRIVLLDEEAGRHEVSGVFNIQNADQILEALERNLSLRMTRLPGGVVIVWPR